MIQARDRENQRLREKMERKEKQREKLKSSRPTKLLGKQLPAQRSHSTSSYREQHAHKVEK